jgi:hypothetical protein
MSASTSAIASDDTAAVTQLLAAKEKAWARRDFAALKALWDTSTDPVYLPEEARRPCLTWSDLEQYWQLTERASRAVSVRLSDVHYRALSTDLIAALYAMHWNFQTRDEQLPVGGDVRVYAVFRRTPQGWRFAQYIEAPLAPIVYMRTLYEKHVDAGFG